MSEILTWLKSVEQMAAALYARAAGVFAGDPQFAGFLQHLSREEEEHLELLAQLTGPTAGHVLANCTFTVDAELRAGVEEPFLRAEKLLDQGALTRDEMLAVIAECEFSEWNEIFLCVIGALKGMDREFQKGVAEIDHHRSEIEQFIDDQPGAAALRARIGRLSPVWKKRILVVEDDLAIATLIKALVAATSEVILAEDGQEGLDRLRREHFDVVISDIQMPRLNGIELHRQAGAIDPDLQRRFILFTGNLKPEYQSYAQEGQIVLLQKPAPLSNIRRAVEEVAGRR